MASPVSFHFTDPDPVMHAAVNGTNSILTSALTYDPPTLNHIVLTSSIAAAITQNKLEGYIFTEKDWNTESESEIARLGKETPGSHIYRGSKTASEKAFWKFREDHKPSFTMTAINPAFVYGPPLVLPVDPEMIAETVKPVWDIFSGKPLPPPMGGSGAFVDVRDVATLMVKGVERGEETDGERYIALAGIGGPQQIADILNEGYPEKKGRIQRGEPGKGYEAGFGVPKVGTRTDSSKGRMLLGREWIGFRECVLDSAKVFERYL